MKIKQILSIVLISAGTSVLSVWGYGKWMGNNNNSYSVNEGKIPANYANFVDASGNVAAPVDFTQASAAAAPAVVHIKTKTMQQRVNSNNRRGNGGFDDIFGDFFGYGPTVIPEQRASGSGVLISEDGYIVTNNHVVSNGNNGIADEINVTLSNKKTYKAKLVGNDPGSDLAVLKIDGKNLPFVLYGNSDNIKIGQWVLAIGYPLNLETTVTAGIVSAKARSLGINQRQANPTNVIESFIQTDAAVNQGNSGGALINTNGELVGINSAIASPTGYYSGYSYAIPVNLVKKIVNDLMKFGSVQRGYLGIQYPNELLSDDQKKANGIPEGEGVYVMEVVPGGAAQDAGLKKGDIITKINGSTTYSGPEMVGKIASYSIGEKVAITYVRNGKEYTTNVTLKNGANTLAAVKGSVLDKMGAEFVNLEAAKAKELGIKGGVVVKGISSTGLIADQTRMKNGFIILKAGNSPVTNVDELKAALSKAGSSTILEGIYLNVEGIFSYGLNELDR